MVLRRDRCCGLRTGIGQRFEGRGVKVDGHLAGPAGSELSAPPAWTRTWSAESPYPLASETNCRNAAQTLFDPKPTLSKPSLGCWVIQRSNGCWAGNQSADAGCLKSRPGPRPQTRTSRKA